MKKTTRDALLLKLGKAQGEAGASARLVSVEVTSSGTFTYQLDRTKLREVRRREGRYLLRTSSWRFSPTAYPSPCANTCANSPLD